MSSFAQCRYGARTIMGRWGHAEQWNDITYCPFNYKSFKTFNTPVFLFQVGNQVESSLQVVSIASILKADVRGQWKKKNQMKQQIRIKHQDP